MTAIPHGVLRDLTLWLRNVHSLDAIYHQACRHAYGNSSHLLLFAHDMTYIRTRSLPNMVRRLKPAAHSPLTG